MINDQQVKKLRSDLNGGMRLAAAALRSGMSEKTARKQLGTETVGQQLGTTMGVPKCSKCFPVPKCFPSRLSPSVSRCNFKSNYAVVPKCFQNLVSL